MNAFILTFSSLKELGKMIMCILKIFNRTTVFNIDNKKLSFLRIKSDY